ncbi:MAG: quinone oxidoreductase family protein, partial [Caulobacteraceae bacterium]
MKAAVYYRNGGPEVLQYEEVPDPECHPKGIVIKTAAVSIEGGDVLNRLRGPLASRPHVVGYQAAGEIIAVGSEVDHLKVGQKVATTGAFGSHAELRSVPARNAWPIPAGFVTQLASVIPVAFGTADDCLFEFGRLKAGETVLIQAGASGVGTAAIQLAKRAGARVIASASSDERLERLRALGMDEGINYAREDLVAEVMRLTEGRGVDLVLDPVGGSRLQSSLASLA